MVSGNNPDVVRAEITLRPLGTFHTGLYDKSAAEIPTYCQKTKRVFVVNAESGQVDVLGLVMTVV